MPVGGGFTRWDLELLDKMRATPFSKSAGLSSNSFGQRGANCDRAMTDRDTDASILKRQGLYPCEAEIARRLSQSQKRWRQIAPEFERQGLPKIDPVMKGRFWPAVEAFFLTRHGLGNMAAWQPDGEERWDVA